MWPFKRIKPEVNGAYSLDKDSECIAIVEGIKDGWVKYSLVWRNPFIEARFGEDLYYMPIKKFARVYNYKRN